MKRQFQLLFSFSMVFFLCAQFGVAQITVSNNLGIFPGPPPFTGVQKFTSIGESGGVPGPINNCDLYGFRAQTSLGNNVNVGIATRFLDSGQAVRTPTVLWGENKRLEFLISGSNGGSGGSQLGCGKRIAYFGDAPGNNFVLTLYGSGRAIGGIWQASDKQLKENITAIPNALDIISNLRGVTYEYQREAFPDLNLPSARQYGFIAQEVAEVIPEAVQDFEADDFQQTEFKIMQYTQILPVLAEAIKEQQVVIEQHEERLFEQSINLEEQLEINEAQAKSIQSLESRLQRLEAMLSNQTALQSPAVNSNISTGEVSLRQNRPNPFKGKTIIEYTIPSEMNNAQLMVYDLNGKLLNTSALAAGNGQITINANELSGGVYFYTIENNGQTLARQKMIVK